MLRHTGTTGEGREQHPNGSGNVRRGALVCAIVGAILIAVGVPAAQAQTYGTDNDNSVWNQVLQTIGLRKPPDADTINYTERAPLVVPPSRDLPPPESAGAPPTRDWPVDSVKRGKNSKDKNAVVPDTAVQTPNPPHVRAPWYNPAGWFDKEEYAVFTGEPVRRNLTDPPAGYRIPSPDRPYGVNPDKNGGKKQATAQDFNLGSLTPPPSGTGGH